MYGEYIYMDIILSAVLIIFVSILVASFVLAQIWKKGEKVLYIICGICTSLIIANLVMYFLWPYL
ncbi:MAG: hypothetical protein ACTSPY_12495 [Candidatus Helarchaeota archaeon]